MPLSPLVVLIGWMPVGIYLFRRFPVRVAILANFFIGWAILPGANYTATNDIFPYWILGVCLPTGHFLTKATATGMAALGGLLLFHSADLKRIRPGICDIPIAVWCCAPLLSAATHWNTIHEGIRGAAYQAISWGVPWLLGRSYFSDRDSQLVAAKACVIAGIGYIPICLFEICAGPQLYAFFYGYQPYRWIGANRYLGYRPIGFLEDGNQLGIWMAAATLIAISLLIRQRSKPILGLPMGWVAGCLASTTLLCQSIGSILLLLFLVPLTLLRRRFVLRTSVVILVFGIMVFAAFRMANLVSLRSLAKRNGPVHSIVAGLASVGRQSLAWRIAQDEGHIAIALRYPLLGSGRWNWWQNGKFRPWGLWLLVFGMYGTVGLIAFESTILLPVVRFVCSPADGHDPDEVSLRQTLVLLILMIAIDSLLNSGMILPYLLLMGGLASPASSLRASRQQSRLNPGLAPS